MILNEKLLKIIYFVGVTTVYAGVYFGLAKDKKVEHFNGLDNSSTYLDCWYFAFTTLSTVGYGDMSPKSKIAKVIVLSHQLLMLLELTTDIFSLIGIYHDGNDPDSNF